MKRRTITCVGMSYMMMAVIVGWSVGQGLAARLVEIGPGHAVRRVLAPTGAELPAVGLGRQAEALRHRQARGGESGQRGGLGADPLGGDRRRVAQRQQGPLTRGQ